MKLASASAGMNPYTKKVKSRSERVSKVVMEWNIPQEVKKVNVVPLFTNLLSRAKTAGPITLLDTMMRSFDLDELATINSEVLTSRFLVESVKAKEGSKLLMGFAFRSENTLEEIKIAIGYEWLRGNRIYLRLNTLGFDHGLEMYLLGYFVKIHPSFVCYTDLQDVVYSAWQEAHQVVRNLDGEDIKQQLQHAYEAGILSLTNSEMINIPMALEKSVMPGTDSQGKVFNTPVITLRVPKAFF